MQEDQSGRPAPVNSGAGFLLGSLAATLALVTVVVVLTGAAPAAPYREGPPPGFSGGFGEQACDACHFSADLNEPGGELRIEGVPQRFNAGETYPLVITLTRPGMAYGGFQLTARFDEGGAQAGTLVPGGGDETRVAVATDRDVQYAYQLEHGADLAEPDTGRWRVMWEAPASGAKVRFNVAGNAADGDDTAEGDYVYTFESVAEPAER